MKIFQNIGFAVAVLAVGALLQGRACAADVVVQDSFTVKNSNWSGLTAAEPRLVTKAYATVSGTHGQTMRVTSKSKKTWSYVSNILGGVLDGSTVALQADLLTKSSASTWVGIAYLDGNQNLIGVSALSGGMTGGNWKTVALKVMVPDGTRYARLAVSGSNSGTAYLDNVLMTKDVPVVAAVAPAPAPAPAPVVEPTPAPAPAPAPVVEPPPVVAPAPVVPPPAPVVDPTPAPAPVVAPTAIPIPTTTPTPPVGNATNVYGGLTQAQQDALGVQVMENAYLTYTIDYRNSRIKAFDKRLNWEWAGNIDIWPLTLTIVRKTAQQLDVVIKDPASSQTWTATATLASDAAEVLYEIKASASSALTALTFPPPFEVSSSSEVVLPFAAGLKMPASLVVSDVVETFYYNGRWGMSFIGVQEGSASWMEIVETPYNFEMSKWKNSKGLPWLVNRWKGEKGIFDHNRMIRYCFFSQDGYVAMAKRYRQFAVNQGWLVKLRDKNLLRNNNIDKLIGAVDLWYFTSPQTSFVQELKNKGINKVLFSYVSDKSTVAMINGLGFLTSAYDIYQDVFPPEVPNTSHEGWPNDLVLNSQGAPVSAGWSVTYNGTAYPAGVVCSISALARAKTRIPASLAQAPYTARFIDTITSSGWFTCYNPLHSHTASEDAKYKIDLLKYASNDLKLVTSSEDGIAVGVPAVDYLEGMMSIHMGRLPDTGLDVWPVTYTTPTDKFIRYQIGEKYRIPLWELVFHDAVVSTWHFGESTDRIPEAWWRFDLLNILYGNMPLWTIRNYAHWQQYEAAFRASYANVSPVFEKVGYEEMLTHAYLTDDRTVQETTFTGNIRIIVNFGTSDRSLSDPAVIVKAHGFVVLQNGVVWKSGVTDYPGLPAGI